jgi:hypothetical protein
MTGEGKTTSPVLVADLYVRSSARKLLACCQMVLLLSDLGMGRGTTLTTMNQYELGEAGSSKDRDSTGAIRTWTRIVNLMQTLVRMKHAADVVFEMTVSKSANNVIVTAHDPCASRIAIWTTTGTLVDDVTERICGGQMFNAGQVAMRTSTDKETCLSGM